MKILKLKPHLTTEQLYERYENESNKGIRKRWHMLWLMQQQNLSAKKAGELVGISQPRTSFWVRTYNTFGSESVPGKRFGKTNAAKLSSHEQETLVQAFKHKVPDEIGSGLWDGPKVVEFTDHFFGKCITRQTGWRLLRQAGYTPQTPHPHHIKSSPEIRDEFKKNAIQ